MKSLTHLDLFSGIGGMSIAAECAGFETVGFCEMADYPTKVLEKHWPNVPKWRDIRTLGGDSFYESTGLRTVDVISGGFPCQPFSVAGKRRGKEDDRYLWPEMLRVIKEIRPTWCIGENVAGIVNMALDTVLSDLESIGYSCQAFVIPACSANAPHRRDRVCIVGWAGRKSDIFCTNATGREHSDIGESKSEIEKQSGATRICKDVAYSKSKQGRGIQQSGMEANAGTNSQDVSHSNQFRCNVRGFAGQGIQRQDFPCHETDTGGEDVPDTDSRSGLVRRNGQFQPAKGIERSGADNGRRTPEYVAGEWWEIEPNVGRVADGIPARVDRLKCLGNAVVPAQFYPIFKAIFDIEMQYTGMEE